ncbi:hypothetical protein PISL3812_08317 [Talaromyces islandicus]|uniref:Transcription factor domain-containing protein n=1 Tax=Talaromyces islandicus TaxID=28573 RepID=A0A0U1M6Q3_TALIS|nr:hypothetical protein PISL3812_08317 [Talaromyces islandicus]
MDESINPSLVQKTFMNQQPQIFKDFICTTFPTMYFHNKFRFTNSSTFPDYAGQHFGSNPYHDAAICCLNAVYLVYVTKDTTLYQVSREKYACALREVKRNLNSDDALSDSMLCTVMLLSIYEIWAQTTSDSWIQHARAVQRLLFCRGVTGHLSGFGRACYFAFRPFLIACALYEGKPCFLDEYEWQQFALTIRMEDSQKPGEWSIFAEISERIFMELVSCPRYISDAQRVDHLSSCEVLTLILRIYNTCDKLRQFVDELQSLLAAHNQLKAGIICQAYSFTGPIPKDFPQSSASLILCGATRAISILEDVLNSIIKRTRVEVELIAPMLFASSNYDTLSHGRISEIIARSKKAASSGSSSFSTPSSSTSSGGFHFISDISRCASIEMHDITDSDSVTWLDRIAGSMGFLGAEIVSDADPSNSATCGVE